MNLLPEKFVQKAKCPDCGHKVESHRETNVGIDRVEFECKALDAAGDQCSCYLNKAFILEPRTK